MEKETAKRRVIFNKSQKEEKYFSHKLSLPIGMVSALGVTEEDREVTLECDGGKIFITKTKNREVGCPLLFWGNMMRNLINIQQHQRTLPIGLQSWSMSANRMKNC